MMLQMSKEESIIFDKFMAEKDEKKNYIQNCVD